MWDIFKRPVFSISKKIKYCGKFTNSLIFNLTLLHFLQIRITKLDEDIAKASPDKVTLKRSVEAIKRQIKAEGGPKLARAQAKVDSLVAQLQILNKTTSIKEVEEKTHRKQVRTFSSLCIRTYVTFIMKGRILLFNYSLFNFYF